MPKKERIMFFKKKVLFICTIFTSLIVSNAYSDRLEDGHSWEPECEGCMKIKNEELARGKGFEIDDIA